jgi:hypothetical protein
LLQAPDGTATCLTIIRGPFEKFVDSPYYSESELCGGAVTVSISLVSDALFTTLHPLLANVLQTVDHFEISCLGAPFSWLPKIKENQIKNRPFTASEKECTVMAYAYFINSYLFVILYTLLAVMFIYCRNRPMFSKLITLQIHHIKSYVISPYTSLKCSKQRIWILRSVFYCHVTILFFVPEAVFLQKKLHYI